MQRLKEFFDAECCKVLAAGGIGTFSSLPFDKQLAIISFSITSLYMLVKLVKQLRDFNKPDKD